MPFKKGNKIRLGMKNSEKQKEAVRKYMKNRIVLEETKKKLSLLYKGKPRKTPWLVGRKQTKEHIEKRIKKMIGEKNPMWKGENVGYYSLHKWVHRHLGKPMECSNCKQKQTTNGRKIHWANKSHLYKRDLSDWVTLCVKCHSKYDRYYKKKGGLLFQV